MNRIKGLLIYTTNEHEVKIFMWGISQVEEFHAKAQRKTQRRQLFLRLRVSFAPLRENFTLLVQNDCEVFGCLTNRITLLQYTRSGISTNVLIDDKLKSPY